MEGSSGSYTKGNFFDPTMIFLLIVIISYFGRIWMDVFILTVNYKDWMKKKCLSTTDRILTLQGSIRIYLGTTVIIRYTIDKCCPKDIQIVYLWKIFRFSYWYSISCNFWLMASLCSYYCVKIADFSHPFFIHLKLRLSGLESAWLLGSAILSLGSSLPFLFQDLEIRSNRNFSHLFKNKNMTGTSHGMLEFHTHVFLVLGYLAILTICATSAALLLFSLWRHRQRMLGSWGGHRSPQTEAHFQAVITIFTLLISNVIVFVCIQLLLTKYLEGDFISEVIASVFLHSSFSLESFISIWGNKKLKNAFCRALYVVRCRGCVG